MKRTVPLAALLLALCLSPTVLAGDSVPVRFETQQATTWGESVYVLGDVAALGAGDLTRAPRMVYGAGGTWTLTVSLPSGTDYRYSYYVRSNDPQALADARNGRQVSGEVSARTAGAPSGSASTAGSFRVRYLSGWAQPLLRYLAGPGDVRDAALRAVGPGRGPGESTWEVSVTSSEAELVFLLHDGNGGVDRPAGGGVYRSGARAFTVTDGQVLVSGGAAGKGRVVRVESWYSHHTQNARPILIYLPPGYDAGARRYPVLYMHDGQNLFGPDAIFGGWRVEEACDSLIAQGAMEPTIVVGVGNTGARMQEYIPEADGGEASKYARFLVEELKPWVDQWLRTRSEREHTGICGSSLGGIVSLFIAWKHPAVFGKVGSLSGSYWLRDWVGQLEQDTARPDLTVWLDSGNSGNSADSMENTYHVRDVLLRKGYVLGDGVAHFVDYGASHNERYWRARIGKALSFLFPPR